MGTNDKMMHFRWMDGIITTNGHVTSCVVGGLGLNT